MKTIKSLALLIATAALLTTHQSATAAERASNADISNWGKPADPDGDCKFFRAPRELLISVPGSNGPHDLAADVDKTNAPRVLKPVSGDFSIQVKVDGRFVPGASSTLPGRVGYNGAGLVLMADDQNVISLARAVLHRPGGELSPYANFEKRADGELERIGDAGEHPLPATGAVFLRLERRGQKLTGAVSLDGDKWKTIGSKKIPADWPRKLKVGVVAISTSEEEFNPRFSDLKLSK